MRIYVLFHDTTSTLDVNQLPQLFIRPILECDADIQTKIMSRSPDVLRKDPYAYDAQMVKDLQEFKPDVIVYSPWETMPLRLCEEAQRLYIPIIGLYWDTRMTLGKFELDIFHHCNYVAVADSLATYYRLSLLNTLMHRPLKEYNTIFCSGYLINKNEFPKLDIPKIYDVLLLGSLEAARIELMEQLKERLKIKNINVTQLGGIIPGSKNLSHEEYITALSQAKILLCSQTQPERVQIKNKVYEFMSCGALCVVDRNYEYDSVVPEDCVVYYDGFEDLVTKIEYYMANPKEAEDIAARGHKWYLTHYDIPQFWRQVLKAAASHRGDLMPLPNLLCEDATRLTNSNPTHRHIESEVNKLIGGLGYNISSNASAASNDISIEQYVHLLARHPVAEKMLQEYGYYRQERNLLRHTLKRLIVRIKPWARRLPFGLSSHAVWVYRRLRINEL